MLLTAATAAAHVTRLHKYLLAQATDAQKWQKYYLGDQPLKFSSHEWREWFGEQYQGFSDNWCQPVVDATAERQGFVGAKAYGEQKLSDVVNRVMAANGADELFATAATEAQYARRAFTLVWPNSNDVKTPLVTYESPQQVYLEYEPGSRRDARFALKTWRDESIEYATLYTAAALYKFERRSSKDAKHTPALILPAASTLPGHWTPREVPGESWPLPNPMGVVPISELPNRSLLTGEPISAISGVAAMQDAVNLIWAHLFTASDFAAMPQRVLLNAQLPKIPVLNDEGQKVGEKPMIELPEANTRRILNFDSPNAKIDSWESASLDGFLKVIERAIAHMIDQTRTPAYYFSSGHTIANISGDTVKALDAGLVKKVNRANSSMHDGMRRTASLIFLAMGKKDEAANMATGKVQFSSPEILSESQKADALSKYKDLGMPFSWIAAQLVEDPTELARIIEQHEKERRDPTLERIARDLDRDIAPAELG